MHLRRICLAFLIGVAGAAPLVAQKSGAELLDEIIRTPGGYDQMCGGPSGLPPDVPLPLYSFGPGPNFYISKSNLSRMEAQRSAVAAEIEDRLMRLDLSRPPVHDGAGSNPPTSGQDPHALSVLLLQAVFELHAVEALPGLLRVEDDLHGRLKKAELGDGSNLPRFLPDGSVLFTTEAAQYYYSRPGRPADNAAAEKLMIEMTARLFQRRLLSVMAALLRHERFAPLLATEMEQRYHEILKQRAEGPQLSAIKQPADIPAAQRAWVSFDPIYHLPVAVTPSVAYIPYTEELRTQIRQFAQDFLKQREAATQRPAGAGEVK